MFDRWNSLETKKPALVFGALGDATRLWLVGRLSNGEAVSITRLASGSRVTRQAVTKHLHVLAKAGLVRGRPHGREQLWALNPASLLEAQRCLDLISRQWDEALARLRVAVEKEE